MTEPTGLRARKKEATRAALSAAALRLALDRGPDNVRVEDIAAAAGVSPRTYNNYFSSREQAVIAAITTQRASRIAAAVAGRPARVPLAEAVIDAVAGHYADVGDSDPAAVLMIISTPALRACYLDTVVSIEEPLVDVITERCPHVDAGTAEVLVAAVGAATRLALRRWLDAASTPSSMPGFVVPTGSLPDLVRTTLTPLAPALDTVAHRR